MAEAFGHIDVTLCQVELRDYFAAAALTGLLANPDTDAMGFVEYASDAYGLADEMLSVRQRNERTTNDN